MSGYGTRGHIVLITVDPLYPNLKRIANLAETLREGGILAYPTDTTLAIGVDAFQPKAVARLYEMTHRDRHKAASLLCADLSMAGRYACITNRVFKAMKLTMPGPYTLVVPADKVIPRAMHGKRREVGIRIPDHPMVQALIHALGTPILTISLRGPDGDYINDPRDVEALHGHWVDAVIDCGVIYPQESTVIDLVEDEPKLVRQGAGDPALYFGGG